MTLQFAVLCSLCASQFLSGFFFHLCSRCWQVFGPEAGQKKVFDSSCRALVQDVLKGGNCLVFTYGVTNAGKTFTFLGQNLILSIHLFVHFERIQTGTFSYFDMLNRHAGWKITITSLRLVLQYDKVKTELKLCKFN